MQQEPQPAPKKKKTNKYLVIFSSLIVSGIVFYGIAVVFHWGWSTYVFGWAVSWVVFNFYYFRTKRTSIFK